MPVPVPEPEPTPEPQPQALPADGQLLLTGATLVSLTGEAGRFTTTTVPGGTYQVVVRMGGSEHALGSYLIPPGGRLELSCNVMTLECQ